MTTIKELTLGKVFKFNGIFNYVKDFKILRTEDGEILVLYDGVKQGAVVDSSLEDQVFLFIVSGENDEKAVFFKINNKFVTLIGQSELPLPLNAETFDIIGHDENNSRNLFLMYKHGGNCGVISISDCKSNYILQDKEGFSDITYCSDNTFAVKELSKLVDGRQIEISNIYENSGRLIFCADCAFNKVHGKEIFYLGKTVHVNLSKNRGIDRDRYSVMAHNSKNVFFCNRISVCFDVPEEVCSIEVAEVSNFTLLFLRVCCQKNEYYYRFNGESLKFELFLITSPNTEIEAVRDYFFIISEYINDDSGRKVKVKEHLVHVDPLDHVCSLESIISEPGIIDIGDFNKNRFYRACKEYLYIINLSKKESYINKFYQNPDNDIKWSCIYDDIYEFVIGIKDGRPLMLIEYDGNSGEVKEINIDWCTEGLEKGIFICKAGKNIFAVNVETEYMIFFTEGKSCQTGYAVSDVVSEEKVVYIVEKENGKLEIFYRDSFERTNTL